MGGDDELTGDGAAQDGAVVNNPEEVIVNNAEGGNVGGSRRGRFS